MVHVPPSTQHKPVIIPKVNIQICPMHNPIYDKSSYGIYSGLDFSSFPIFKIDLQLVQLGSCMQF